MRKIIKLGLIISVVLIVIVLIIGGYGIKKHLDCELIIVEGKVLTVNYSPDSFGGFEHWSGIVVENNKEVSYMVLEPVKIGDTIFSKRGCGYPKESIYDNWNNYDL